MIGPWQLLIILVIVVLLFGTKRLKNLGPDLGNAIKGFRSAIKEGENEQDTPEKLEEQAENTMNDTTHEKEKDHS